MSKNEDIAIRSIAKRIKEEGFDAIQDLMNLAISGHLDDRLPEGEDYICPTCRQKSPLLFDSLARQEIRERNMLRGTAAQLSGRNHRPLAASYHVVGACENCGAVTGFSQHRDSAPVIFGMLSLIFKSFEYLREEREDD